MSLKFGLIYKLLLFALLNSLVLSTLAKPSKDSKDNAAAKDTDKHAEFPEEDSDMLMEPNDFSPVTVLRSFEPPFRPIPPSAFHHPHGFTQSPSHNIHAAPRIDDSNTAQNYYPPYFREAPPLGHSRPYFPTPDGPAIPKFAAPLPKVEPIPGPLPPTRNFDTSVLGSGDFGVLRGGTFYPEEEMPYHPEDNSDFTDYYGDANNGHGRPSSEGVIQKYTYPEEQFANFRDFADINTPGDGAFSQFVVVYAAKNATTHPNQHPHPKNIFEQLELLDREKALEAKKSRPSKSKSKLAKTKLQKVYKKDSSPKDAEYEPLLALS